MATHDYVIDNQATPAFRSDLNNALMAIVSQNSNATAPTTTYADMFWYDTATNILKKRNEANSAWINLGTIDEGAGTFTPTGGGLTANVQEFTSSGTWTMPANAKLVYVELWGGGGGGGSGRRGATSSGRNGGGGGGGSAGFFRTYRASELTSTVSVTIGAGGAGGAAQTVNTTNGNNGTAGGNSSFGSYSTATGGSGGQGGLSSDLTNPGLGGRAASPGLTDWVGGEGGYAVTQTGGYQGANGLNGTYIALGGGGGGTIDFSNINRNAGLGGAYYATGTTPAIGTGVGASVNGTAGASIGLGGGGGGPGSAAAAGSGGAGGTAAGGGGGGGATNGFNSGAGGAGGNGLCRVTTYY